MDVGVSSVLPIDLVIGLTRYRLYEAIAINGMDAVDAAYVAGMIGHGVTPSFVRMAFRQLEELKDIHFESRPSPLNLLGQTLTVSLTPGGARLIESELRDPTSIVALYRDGGLDALELDLVPTGEIPASDRIVSSKDNQLAYERAVEALEDLHVQLGTNNEVGAALGDSRDLAVVEVSTLSALLRTARVRAEPVMALARKSLTWIAEKAGSAAVTDLAKRALSAIIEWLT